MEFGFYSLLVIDWLELALRWLHVVTAIAWIGSSFYFIALDRGLRKTASLPELAHGEEWQVHGGGFCHIQKYLVAPAALPEHLTLRVQQLALDAHRALELRDFSRTDFILPEGEDPVLLETNTLPGMTGTSLFPEAAQAVGISFERLVDGLVRRALARGPGARASGQALPGT